MIFQGKSIRQFWNRLLFQLVVAGFGSFVAVHSVQSQPRREAEKEQRAELIQTQLPILVNEFGADGERIPPDFVEKVNRWASLYETRDRSEIAAVFGPKREAFESVRQTLKEADLPADLAFVTLIESHFQPEIRGGNNAGLWQFEPATARSNGLRVGSRIDERLDPEKSTEAACRYLSKLKRTLGPDACLLTVIAAYNLGPTRLQNRLKTLDPEQANDFWHLYSARIIPALTRTHIARLMAAILVSRNQSHFGFAGPLMH